VARALDTVTLPLERVTDAYDAMRDAATVKVIVTFGDRK